MTTLATRIADLATRIATECKAIRTMVNGNVNGLAALATTNKSNLVAALNELKTNLDGLAASAGATINDGAATSTTQTYSIDKIVALIGAATSALVNSAPGALDTLKELADAIGDDANFATTITTALGNRLRIDAAQGLTAPQQAQGRTNLDAYGSVEIGNPDTNFVSTFNTGLS